MITIKNVKTIDGRITNIHIESSSTDEIECDGQLTALPSVIDSHVHFAIGEASNWDSEAKAALAGGITTVFNIAENSSECGTKTNLEEKKAMMQQRFDQAHIPLRHYHFFTGTNDFIQESIGLQKISIGIKVMFGNKEGSHDGISRDVMDQLFRFAAQQNVIVAIHAEDEKTVEENRRRYGGEEDYRVHSKIHDRRAALKAVKDAIALAQKYGTQLYVLCVSTLDELKLIREAKANELLVYAETTPQHLFLTEDDYAKWGGKVLMDPPLRTKDDQEALWKAIHDGTIDSVASNHKPRVLEKTKIPYEKCPSGVPGMETMLPLMLNAYNEGKIKLEQIIALTRRNLEEIYRLPHNEDLVLVDLEQVKTVEDSLLQTHCGWSPYAGMRLQGWPVYTILNGKVYEINQLDRTKGT